MPKTLYNTFGIKKILRPINRDFKIEQVGMHHQFYQGKKLFHVFSVISGGMFFKLVLDTENLFWKLEEVSDGNS